MRTFLVILMTLIGTASFAAYKDSVKVVIRDNAGDIEACTKDATTAQKEEKGIIVVNWTIDSAGKATNVVVDAVKSTLKVRALQKCLVEKIKSWDFPPAEFKGPSATISYPFVITLKPQHAGGVESSPQPTSVAPAPETRKDTANPE